MSKKKSKNKYGQLMTYPTSSSVTLASSVKEVKGVNETGFIVYTKTHTTGIWASPNAGSKEYYYSVVAFSDTREEAEELARREVKRDLNKKLFIAEHCSSVFADAPIIVERNIEDAEFEEIEE